MNICTYIFSYIYIYLFMRIFSNTIMQTLAVLRNLMYNFIVVGQKEKPTKAVYPGKKCGF